MTKSATVRAQQRWEYMEVTRKTEHYLTGELNDLGKEGWELVTVLFHKDAKSSLGSALVWTAFLKRPHAAAPPAAPGAAGAAAKPAVEAPKPEERNKPARHEAEDSDDIFEFRDE